MKTPEEIKKGLECCKLHDGSMYTDCSHCPYYLTSAQCDFSMHEDALAYIRQLEQELAFERSLKRSAITMIGGNLTWTIETKECEREEHRAEECRYYHRTKYSYDCERRPAVCVGTKECDPCRGDGCPDWKPKED